MREGGVVFMGIKDGVRRGRKLEFAALRRKVRDIEKNGGSLSLVLFLLTNAYAVGAWDSHLHNDNIFILARHNNTAGTR